ncbi:ClpXP protease specificity-enhancing factor [Marinicellulosiphila megalodicopiae]|uniref:ClpXP protease specificity-enhancing factor n=1 Tax=Marinicellulosiphila megalodicopiae TaxID=2724896 RepID=UPI003BAFB479
MSEMTSNKPYLMRATIEWIVDNGCTPHVVVDTFVKGVSVPEGFDRDGQLTLNISVNAVRDFVLDNQLLSFSAKFNGMPMQVYVPCGAILAVIAQENGQGIFFKSEEAPEPPEPAKPKGRPGLKLVK